MIMVGKQLCDFVSKGDGKSVGNENKNSYTAGIMKGVVPGRVVM